LPRIGFGTFNNWDGKPQDGEDESLVTAIRAAIDAGYRHFDCAELYRNEKSIGNALAAAEREGKVSRSELFLVSKAWNHRRTAAELRVAVQETLKALQTDYLDLYLIHWPVCWAPGSVETVVDGDNNIVIPAEEDPRGEADALAETWRGMEDLVAAGLVRQIGVSNFGIARLKRLLASCRVRPTCNQVECHPHLAQTELRSFCEGENIELVAYHPIGKPNHRKEGEPVAMKEPCVIKIAERIGCTPTQVILAWHLNKGVVAIPKSSTPSRITENFGASGVSLTTEDIAAIDALDCGARFCKPRFMTSWD
jgi:alcohol dehydrogenase (NADP+)